MTSLVLGVELGELRISLSLGRGVGILGRHGERIALRLEAAFVGHPVDNDIDIIAFLILGGEAVATPLDRADLLSDLFDLPGDVLGGGVGGLVGVLEAAVLVGLGGHPEDAVVLQGLLLGPGGSSRDQGENDQLRGRRGVRDVVDETGDEEERRVNRNKLARPWTGLALATSGKAERFCIECF